MVRRLFSRWWVGIVAVLFGLLAPVAPVSSGVLPGASPLLGRAALQEAPLATAVPPSWVFSVYEFRDPYDGDIQQPDLPGTRVVGAEVEIVNTSDESLTVYLNNLRLHTEPDITYPSGLVVGVPDNGVELTPRLVEGVVEPGQRVRGWVWWRIPEGEDLREIVFYPSPPPPSIIPLPLANASS